MKLIKSILLTSAFLILSMPVLADDEKTKSGFDDKGRDHASHVEVHTHVHPEVRDAPAKPKSFQNKDVDPVKTTEVHVHVHPEVRDAPAEPEPFKGK
jgi:hypothetical protein